VAQWTLFTDCFTHLRTGETAADPRILMASLLAVGLHRAADWPPRGRGARTAREISGRPSPGALPQKADQAGIAGRGRLPQVPLQDLDGWLWGHLAGSFG
jgi:hypothetical protein